MSSNVKFLKLNLTEKDVGSIVKIHDNRKRFAQDVLWIITSVNGPVADARVTTKSMSDESGYRLKFNGTWGNKNGIPELGITHIYTKDKNPEYFL